MRIIILILLSTLSTIGKADSTIDYTIANILIVTDWAQTRFINRSSRYGEVNPIIGNNVHHDRVDLYFATNLLVYNYFARRLPTPEQRFLYHSFQLLVSAYAVDNNARLGVRLRF